MEINFESLREEALAKSGLEPFILTMPKGKPIEVPSIPTRLFTQRLEFDGNKLSLSTMMDFLEAAVGPANWKRLGDLLEGEGIEVVVMLVDKLLEHFNLTLESSEPVGKSEASDES